MDGDEVPNGEDNCPAVVNADQLGADGDGVGLVRALGTPQVRWVHRLCPALFCVVEQEPEVW